MPPPKCERPAPAETGNEPQVSKSLASDLNLAQKPDPAQAATSRRLVGAHWSSAVPDTVMSQAFLKALRRRAVQS
jgi:hypothetical protein